MTTPMEDAYRQALANITHEGNEARRELASAQAETERLRETAQFWHELVETARTEIAALKKENERLRSGLDSEE